MSFSFKEAFSLCRSLGSVSSGSLDMIKRAIKIFEQVCLHDLVWPDLFAAMNMDIFVSSCKGERE